MVSFCGRPAVVSEEELASVRLCLSTGGNLAPHPYLRPGRRVVISRGPLAGIQGVLTKAKTGFRVVVYVEAIGRGLSVEVSTADISAVN